jgi:hypothetical protein
MTGLNLLMDEHVLNATTLGLKDSERDGAAGDGDFNLVPGLGAFINGIVTWGDLDGTDRQAGYYSIPMGSLRALIIGSPISP